MKFDRLAEKINHATYGYAGFFDAVKIEEDDLDRIISFDARLLEETQKISEAGKIFKMEIVKQKYERAKEHVQKLRELIEGLEQTFDQRAEIIQGVR
jgi:thymidylate synthase